MTLPLRCASGTCLSVWTPLTTTGSLRVHANDRIDEAQTLLDALAALSDPQVGLRLLRRCAGFCKLVYSARTVPGSMHFDELLRYDRNVCTALGTLTGLRRNEAQWGQATRGFAFAGLGLRSSARHAHAAYTASRTQTHELCRELDGEFVWEGADGSSLLAQGLRALNFTRPPQSSS